MARIAGVNIPTNKNVHIGLTYIYGIGNKFSKQICSDLEIPNSKRVNELTDDLILKIREYIDKNFTVEGEPRCRRTAPGPYPRRPGASPRTTDALRRLVPVPRWSRW